MHHELVTMAISGISPAVTFDEFRFRSMIFNESVAKDVLDFLKDHGIGSESNDIIIFCEADRLKTGVIALQMGADIEMISNALSWRDFEALTLKMLHSLGYVTETNIRLTKPHGKLMCLELIRGLPLSLTVNTGNEVIFHCSPCMLKNRCKEQNCYLKEKKSIFCSSYTTDPSF